MGFDLSSLRERNMNARSNTYQTQLIVETRRKFSTWKRNHISTEIIRLQPRLKRILRQFHELSVRRSRLKDLGISQLTKRSSEQSVPGCVQQPCKIIKRKRGSRRVTATRSAGATASASGQIWLCQHFPSNCRCLPTNFANHPPPTTPPQLKAS